MAPGGCCCRVLPRRFLLFGAYAGVILLCLGHCGTNDHDDHPQGRQEADPNPGGGQPLLQLQLWALSASGR